ncbi:cytochrome c family protein [Pseudodesulfovibrio sp.]|nr:cytochrome c family protein [Pseudodesulfovibrio sp.]
MQRRYLQITILTGILIIAALAGYLIPASSDGPPIRVLLENKGGKVIFMHKAHMEIEDNNCASCHHTSGDEQTPPSCANCHVKKFDDVFIADHPDTIGETQCVSCHHPEATISNFSHDNHTKEYAEDDCQACHHDESLEPEPQACSDCHEKEAIKDIPSLKDANHAKCADCHEDMYNEGLKGCQNCHTREMDAKKAVEPQPCSTCHAEPVELLIPTTTNAFHGKCMGCHEIQETGPFGDDACYQCHMK